MERKGIGKVLVLLLSCALLGSMSGCSLPFGKGAEEEENEGIEASVSKVRIEVGEEDEIEIRNYDDLKKLDCEVEDEDIASVEEDDDGVYIVTGISEGKTTVIFTAKDCEDLVIKITVEGGMEPQPLADSAFELSATDAVVDYDDSESYIYIDNWDEIRDMAKSSIRVSSSDESVLSVTFDPEYGSIYLCAWDEGYATVTVEAEGFETAFCDVECTHDGGGTDPGSVTGEIPDYDTLDINYNGSVNLWSHNMGSIVATVYEPSGYTLDYQNGGFNSGDDIYYTYFDSRDMEGYWITVVGEMPFSEWDYLVNGNEPDDCTLSNLRPIGDHGESTVVAMDETLEGYDYIIIAYDYYNHSYSNTDYVGVVIPADLVEGWDDDDLFALFSEMFPD